MKFQGKKNCPELLAAKTGRYWRRCLFLWGRHLFREAFGLLKVVPWLGFGASGQTEEFWLFPWPSQCPGGESPTGFMSQIPLKKPQKYFPASFWEFPNIPSCLKWIFGIFFGFHGAQEPEEPWGATVSLNLEVSFGGKLLIFKSGQHFANWKR